MKTRILRTITLLNFLLLSNSICAQRQHFVLSLPNIHCDKTTESGQDELYIILTWKTSFGSTGTIIRPESGDWSMNDGNRNESNIVENSIYGFDLSDGESIDVVCSIMERDDGTPSQYLNLGSKILSLGGSATKNIYLVTAATILKFLGEISNTFQIKDTDDWIGSFSYHVVKYNGTFNTTFNAIYNLNDNSNGTNSITPFGNNCHLTYSGDGSSYVMDVEIR